MATGKINLSCGHSDKFKPFGWELYQRDYDKDGEVLTSSTQCTKCFVEKITTDPTNCWLNYEEAWEAIFGQT